MPFFLIKELLYLDTVAHGFNPSTLEAGAEGLPRVQSETLP